VVVGVPARDESQRVGACLTSLIRAASIVGPGIDVLIVVAADSCTDDTEQLVTDLARADERIHLVSSDWRSAGAARAAAIERGLSLIQRCERSRRVWIATTDADTVVGEEWLVRQIDHADRGVDAIAGIIELLEDDDHTEHVAQTFQRLYLLGAQSHVHVHGANLGVRADAYRAVGGFPDAVLAEDHALWNALRRGGFSCLSSLDVSVATSARLRSRAPGGFADTIAAAMSSSAPGGALG
jgi:glycosyltransferase involved in cell wall biosynthesis